MEGKRVRVGETSTQLQDTQEQEVEEESEGPGREGPGQQPRTPVTPGNQKWGGE